MRRGYKVFGLKVSGLGAIGFVLGFLAHLGFGFEGFRAHICLYGFKTRRNLYWGDR